MPDYKGLFALNLKKLRKARGLTQEALATSLGYSKKTVSKWECGACVPDIEALFSLSKALQVSLEALFEESRSYLLGIDGGGTKTELVLADENGDVLRRLFADTCNPMDIGIENSKATLRRAIYEICDGIPLSSVVMFAGIAGGTTADMQPRLCEFFNSFGFRAFRNDTDLKLIISAGLSERDGISLILGTGICAFSQLRGEHFKTAGWGYFIDEGGSGFNLGRDALSAYFAALDGSGEQTLISEEIDSLYPHGAKALMGHIYDGGKKAIAAFAAAPIAAFKRGDATAERILRRNMKYAANIIETAAARFSSDEIEVVISGGLTNEPIITELLAASVPDSRKYKIRKLESSPVTGAIKLAKKLLSEVCKNA
ncbi:MAG: XRE family transcriptional regulator [Oscillospiraceae bacterium]|nr:XRE family transcriptional regulator [Oscillospiraceae bacterium]